MLEGAGWKVQDGRLSCSGWLGLETRLRQVGVSTVGSIEGLLLQESPVKREVSFPGWLDLKALWHLQLLGVCLTWTGSTTTATWPFIGSTTQYWPKNNSEVVKSRELMCGPKWSFSATCLCGRKCVSTGSTVSQLDLAGS